jgi:hypothetical protein
MTKMAGASLPVDLPSFSDQDAVEESVASRKA